MSESLTVRISARQRVLKGLRVQQVTANAILTEFSRKRTQNYGGYGKKEAFFVSFINKKSMAHIS